MPVRKPDRRYGRNGPNYRAANSSFDPRRSKTIEASALRSSEATSQGEKTQATRLAHSIDERMGFTRYESGRKKVGWLCNMHSTGVEDSKVPGGRAAVDYYFLEEDGGSFKATVEYDPYFLIAVRRGKEAEVEEWIRRKFEGAIKEVKRTEKEDLSMPNHLLGYRRALLELRFANVGDLLGARKDLLPIAERNKLKMNAMDTYAEVASANAGFDFYDDERDSEIRSNGIIDASNFIVDIREYDVPYHVRVAIDKGEKGNCKSMRLAEFDRYSNRKMVHGRSKAWRYFTHVSRGEIAASRSGCYGLRYRDYETTTQISRLKHRSSYDDILHDRRSGISYHQSRDCV